MAIRAGGSISEGGSNITARRTPSISAPRNYVYKHVYIYFLAAGQVMAVWSLESGNLMVNGPLTDLRLRELLSSKRSELWYGMPVG